MPLEAFSVAENKPSQAPSSEPPACVCQVSPSFAGTHIGLEPLPSPHRQRGRSQMCAEQGHIPAAGGTLHTR